MHTRNILHATRLLFLPCTPVATPAPRGKSEYLGAHSLSRARLSERRQPEHSANPCVAGALACRRGDGASEAARTGGDVSTRERDPSSSILLLTYLPAASASLARSSSACSSAPWPRNLSTYVHPCIHAPMHPCIHASIHIYKCVAAQPVNVGAQARHLSLMGLALHGDLSLR